MGACTSKKNNKNNFQANEKIQGSKSSNSMIVPDNIRKYYNFGPILGQGSFGTVKIAYRLNSDGKVLMDQPFAIKTINKIQVSNSLYLLKQEFKALSKLDHPNIIRFHEMYEDEQFIYFVMEYCSGGNLLNKLAKNGGTFSEEDVLAIMSRLFSAIAYMHRMGIMHRDMKPENVLLVSNEEQTEIKIIDFGLSKKLKQNNREQQRHSRVGTALYMAPEVINGIYDMKCDEWSLGCIMYFLICGNHPFSGDHEYIIYCIQKKEVQFTHNEWQNIRVAIKKTVYRLLHKDPRKRLSAEEVLQMDWCKLMLMGQLKINQGKGQLDIASTPFNQNNLDALRSFAGTNTLKKEILKILVKQLSQDQIHKLTLKFKEIDVEHNGYITVEELAQALKNMGYLESEIEVEKIIKSINSDEGSMRIKYSQFLAALIDQKLYLDKERLWNLFQMFDRNNKNFLTVDDLLEVLKRRGQNKLNPQSLVEIIGNQEGIVTFKNFCKIMGSEVNQEDMLQFMEKQLSPDFIIDNK